MAYTFSVAQDPFGKCSVLEHIFVSSQYCHRKSSQRVPQTSLIGVLVIKSMESEVHCPLLTTLTMSEYDRFTFLQL